MHKLFARQLAKARKDNGEIDIVALGELVAAAYDEMDRDLRRTDRSIALMIEELGEAHQQLVDAFEVVPEGLALFDPDDRFVMWNRRYAEMYGLTGETIAVGTRFEDALRAGLERGQYPEARGREEEWLQERLTEHRKPSSTREQRLPGDRWVRIEERRTKTGGSVGVRIDITDLKQREESFRLLFKSNPIPMFVCDARTLSLLAANEAAIDHYGYGRDHLMSLSVFDLRHPSDRDDARLLAQTREGNYQSGQIRRHIKADGTQIEVAIYSKPLDYYGTAATLFAAIDVSERRNAERLLQEQKRHLDTALENMSQGLCMFDPDGRITLFNERYARLVGLPPDRLKGRSLLDLLKDRHARGQFSENPDEFFGRVLAEMREGRTSVKVLETPNGRALRVVDQPMDDGGWVATFEDITEIRKAEAQISHLARHDALTGLPNRTTFRERMEEALQRAQRGEQVAVHCLDLDHFKDINDTLGHPIGDELLVAVARRLRDCVRETDTVARLGGDEFAIIQTGIHDQSADTETLASRLIDVVGAVYRLSGHEAVIGVSIGISIAPSDSSDPHQLLRNADMALYRAKADGRGTYRFFEIEMDARAQARRALELELRAALVKSEFELYFQPIYDLGTVEIIGFEALVRWNHPVRGLVPPANFIQLAEETGLIIPLGEWVLREACGAAAAWSHPVRVSVNLSPVQFRSRNLAPTIVNALSASGLKPERLELEITETVLLDNNAANMETLHALRNLGVRISMDDFGTGYCSLSYLRSFPFDKIKIDQSFVREIGAREDSLAIVRAVTGLGRSLSITTTAEGVETEEQLSFLRAEGCREVQGYLFSRPRPASEVERMLAEAHRQRAVA